MLIAVAIIALFPLYWLVATAFKSNSEILDPHGAFVPRHPSLVNFEFIFNHSFGDFLRNSLIVVTITTAISLMIGTCSAYALSRFRLFGGRNEGLSFGMLAARALPPIILVIPIYLTVQQAGLLNNIVGLILVYSAINVPFVVWLMRSFFDEIPKDLEAAAMTDGASPFRAFREIILPLVGPGLAATAIFTVISVYNEFLFALVLTATPTSQTVPVGASLLIGRIETNFGGLAAAGVIAMLPVVLFVVFMHRRLVRGLTAGAVK